ncbi:MAG: histidine phosphatase family protein [Xanthomonadaceae bacterium]|nr:histidine phosphatase family protein [Xanthomonadaceae bacterium]
MAELLFVRHGQASFGAVNYDELSPLGWRQARLLGDWLSSHDAHDFDAVALGTLVRHRDTLAGVREAYDRAGRRLPQATMLPALDEFDHRAVFGAFATHHADHPSVVAAEGGRSRDVRAMARFLREALLAWTRGALDAHVPEPWPAFRARVRSAADALTTSGARRLLVVTSGGVMSQLAQQALGAPDETAVELNLGVRNSALAEFRAGEAALVLSSWNALPHLAAADHRALWTYY